MLLDTFIVTAQTLRPGDRHWEAVAYDRADWERVLGEARTLPTG